MMTTKPTSLENLPRRLALPLAAVSALIYVAAIVLANVLVKHFGLIDLHLWGMMVPAGTFAIGVVILARNTTQQLIGRIPILVLMGIGCLLSWWLADPQIAAASAAAFACSETIDMAIFTPLRNRGWSRAVAVAALFAAVADTFIFLSIAGFPLTAPIVGGQLFVKIGISWAVAVGVWLATLNTRTRTGAMATS
jgi:uncharacterized PurR-regulated membrane protein YhhQ (DUF165 family)